MEVQIEFTFDGSTLGRKQLVTFEELYDITNLEEPKKVTNGKMLSFREEKMLNVTGKMDWER